MDNLDGKESSTEFTIRDEANALVAWAFRNGPLENLHAGKHSSLLEDASLNRITDAEMKELMISASRQLARLLELKTNAPEEYERQIRYYGDDIAVIGNADLQRAVAFGCTQRPVALRPQSD